MPTRATLPERYVKSYGTLVDDFDNTDWAFTQQGTAGSQENQSTTHFLEGSSALKSVYPAAETRNVHTLDLSASPRDYSDANNFVLWFYIDAAVLTFSVKLRFYDGAKWNAKTWSAANHFPEVGWNCLIFPWDDGTDPTTDRSTINTIDVRIEDVGDGDEAVNIWLDSIYYNVKVRPKLIISFDDAVVEHKDEAYDYMQPLGLVGSCSIPKDNVDSGATKLTSSDIDTMYANGWEFVCHGVDNSDTVISYSGDMVAYVAMQDESREFLRSSGWQGSENFIVWTGCGTTNEAIAAVTAAGFTGARRCETDTGDDSFATAGHPNNKGLIGYNPYALVGRIHNFGDTVADNTDYVDKLISSGTCGQLIFHAIDAGASTGNDITVTDFQAVIDHIADKVSKGLIDVVTFKQYTEGL